MKRSTAGLFGVNLILGALALGTGPAEAQGPGPYCGPCYEGFYYGSLSHASSDLGQLYLEHSATDVDHGLADGACFYTGPHSHICCILE